MSAIRATWINGQILPSEPVVWPEGTKLIVEPATPRARLRIRDLNQSSSALPPLGDDADEFASDISDIRAEFPADANPTR
jgi:hypothetical protein